MEKTDLVADSLSIQGFKQWNDDHNNEEVDEILSSAFSSYINSFECSKSEDKIEFLDEFSKNI